MGKEIQLSVPNLNIEIADNLRECVETGWVSTGGRFISEFEEKVAAFVHVPEAVGCQSGTAGLHTALRILGIGSGDEVIVPTLTFIAAVNPVVYQGATPVFIDCDDFFCMDAEKLERFCSDDCTFENGKLIDKESGRTVKAIIPVHVFGNIADMDRIMSVAEKYGLKVLEDATEALGSFIAEGKYKGSHAGTIGDIGVFSFNANKIITTGGGGMIVSKSKEYIEKARYLTTTAKDDILYFVHDEVGYNYRMLNIQAALGVSQIGELEKFIGIKKANYERYATLLGDTAGIELLPFKSGQNSNYWFYSLLIDDAEWNSKRFGETNRDILMGKLIESGIQCRPIWKLIHTQKAYREYRAKDIEKACFFEKNVLNIPCSTSLSAEDVAYVSDKINTLI